MINSSRQVTSSDATKSEPTGLVTSDSLAAESLESGGDFAANNPHAAASKQPSASTTSNTTDTSGATRLAPAVDAEAREAQEGWSETSQLNAGKGLGKGSDSFNPGSVAPTGGYAGASDQARPAGELRPHGTNITEDPTMTGKRVVGAIGTRQDPSRVAELKFQKEAAAVPGGATGGGKDSSVQAGESKFSGLKDEAT